MSYQHEPQVTVDVMFPYFKQGDDFGSCGGDLDAFINMHQNVINMCRQIQALIPDEAQPYVSGDGDTHSCRLTGPRSIMERLVRARLATNFDYSDEDYIPLDSDDPDA